VGIAVDPPFKVNYRGLLTGAYVDCGFGSPGVSLSDREQGREDNRLGTWLVRLSKQGEESQTVD
jgi:hypothetical protein